MINGVLVSPWLLYTGNKAFRGDYPRLLTLLQFYYQPRIVFDYLCQSVFYEGFDGDIPFLVGEGEAVFQAMEVGGFFLLHDVHYFFLFFGQFDCVFLFGFHLREEKDVLNRGRIGHNHAQAVNANAQPGGGVGGMAYSSARKKSSSSAIASSSPRFPRAACSSKRRRWSIGSFNSVKELQISLPLQMASKRSANPSLLRCFLASGDISMG